MSGVAAIGEPQRVAGYALAGAEVRVAEDAATALQAWRSLDPATELVLLSRAAADALGPELDEQDRRIWVVLPE